MAEVAITPAMTAATVAVDFCKGTFGELSLMDSAVALKEKIAAVQGGDIRDAEAMLAGQAFALNAIFTELARRSASSIGQNLNASERYLRLALKAQSQCRATLETLASIKSPPIVYARQANVTTGPQQVNNGVSPESGAQRSTVEQNKLLEAEDGQWLDTRATGAASGADSAMAAMGGRHGASD